jgi:hypothetical protein
MAAAREERAAEALGDEAATEEKMRRRESRGEREKEEKKKKRKYNSNAISVGDITKCLASFTLFTRGKHLFASKNDQPCWSQSNQQTADQSQIPSGLVFPSEHIPCGYQSTGRYDLDCILCCSRQKKEKKETTGKLFVNCND